MTEPFNRFLVALSFPGEHRKFVEDVADFLRRELGEGSVLYDRFHEAEFARPNLDTHLQALYHDQSRLVVVFLCADYERKEWPGLEWRAIRDLIKSKKDSSIMLIRLDEANVSGVFSIDGYISVEGRAPQDIASLIIERLQILEVELQATITAQSISPEEPRDTANTTDLKKKEKIPQPIRDVIKRGADFLNTGYFEKAKQEFQQAVTLAEETGHNLSIIKAKEHLALVLIHADDDLESAKSLLRSCVELLAVQDDEEERADVLERLAQVHQQEGDLEQSESLLRQSLTISEGLADKTGQAGTLLSLAWTVGRDGRTDEALDLNRKAYELLTQVLYEAKQDDTRELEFVHRLLANLFVQRAKIHQRRADPDEAEMALEIALKWQRKHQPNHELGKLLCELAELKFFKREWNAGARLLEEAAGIYQERDMMPQLAECLQTMGRVHASVGDFAKAGEFFSSAAAAANRSGRSQEAADVLLSLAHLALEESDINTARQLFENAKTASQRRSFQAKCLMELAQLASKREQKDEHRRLVNEAIDLLRAELATVKSEMERAQINFTLGWYLREVGQLDEALSCVRKARARFEAANDAYGAAKASFEIAGLLDQMGRKEESKDTCHAVLKMVEGKPFFEIEAAVNLALAQFVFHDDKNLTETERLLERSLELCREHDLQILPQALLFKDEFETVKRVGTEAAASIPEMLDFLRKQLALCPVNKEGYVRFWAFSHARKFASALRATLGPNVAIQTDELEDFLKLSSALKPYRDWSLILPSEKYPEDVLEIIPIEGEMLVPADVPILAFRDVRLEDSEGSDESESRSKSGPPWSKLTTGAEVRAGIGLSHLSTGGAIPRYYFVLLDEESEQFGGAKGGVQGWSMALPPVVHKLLQERDLEELKSNQLFFLYYNRGLVEESKKLWYDLAGLHGLRCLPVYTKTLPQSEKVRVVASCSVTLPCLTDEAVERQKRPLRNIRKALLEVIAANESTAASRLSDLAALAADLLDEVGGESTPTVFYALAFEYERGKKIHPAIVVK
jgi:tetratricopeptide (TPR) repeat protein